nr:immunoglobulin light chain junction region [Macaca mulatta]
DYYCQVWDTTSDGLF